MNIKDDGKKYINVYSRGKTLLGKRLSNFYDLPIRLPEGLFSSIEGYWYWLQTNHQDKEKLCKLSGVQAKIKGRELRKSMLSLLPEEKFREKIRLAITIKCSHRKIKNLLLESYLPFVHYYVFAGKTVIPDTNKWVIKHIEHCRTELKINNYFV